MQIRVDDLAFSYGSGALVLQNISLKIDTGEAVALVGHNGSGKTTLVKHLNGLHKPSSGSVLIDGDDTAAVKTALLSRKVALLFQNPDDQICKRTVWDEVSFGPKNLGYSRKRIEELTEDALADFALSRLKQKNPHDFGYSIRKRIAMASIVAMDTTVLVFDEPTAGLDPYEVSLLTATIGKLRGKNKTIVVISHDMDFVAENIERTICLKDGMKMFDGTVRQFFSSPSLMSECGLLQPQVVQLGVLCGIQDTVALTPQEFVTEFRHRFPVSAELLCNHVDKCGRNI